MNSLAHVRASQLQQCLATRREPSEGKIQATLYLIFLRHIPSDLINITKRVFTVSHTLEGTSNQPSTAVPAQINSNSRGQTPMTDSETTDSLYTATDSAHTQFYFGIHKQSKSTLLRYDSITVSSTRGLTSVSMRYSQGEGVNTSLSRIMYCTHVECRPSILCRSFPVCVWVSSVARSCASKDANIKDYVCKPKYLQG